VLWFVNLVYIKANNSIMLKVVLQQAEQFGTACMLLYLLSF